MSKRSVEVELVLKTAQYKAEARSAKDSTEALDRSVEATDRDLKKLPPDAAKAAAAMKLLGAESATANLKLEDGTGKSSTAMGKLEQDLVKARGEVHKFADEFNRTGSSDSLAKMFKADDAVKELEKFKGELEKALPAVGSQAGPGMASNLMSSASSSITSNPILVAAIAAILVIGAPLIGAALNAALLSGIGLGGIAIGIVGQLHNPMVHAAAADVGNQLLEVLHSATAPFAAPLAASLHMVGDALAHLLKSIDFGKLSQALVPLAAGLSLMIDKLGPGLNEALSSAVPLLSELASWLPFIGTALSDMFHEMAGSTTGAKEGLRTLMLIIGGGIELLGRLIGSLSNAYAALVAFGDGLSNTAQKLFGWIPGVNSLNAGIHEFFHTVRYGGDDVVTFARLLGYNGAAAQAAADNMSQLSSQITAVRITADTLAASMVNKLFTATMNVDQADIAWHQSLLNLHDTLAQNGLQIDKHTHQISENTKGGLENRQAILSAVSANMQNYQAFVAVGGSATDAARQYDDNTAALEKQMRQAGYTQSQIDGLIGKYKSIPDTVNTRIQFEGLQDAIDRLDTLIRRINGLPYSKEVNVTYREHVETIASGGGGEGRRAHGGIRHAAVGMIVAPRSPGTLIGEPETGGEALIPLRGISAARAASLGQIALSGYGMDVVPRGSSYAGGGKQQMNLTLTLAPGAGGTSADRAIAQVAAYAIRSGSLVLTAGSTPVTVK